MSPSRSLIAGLLMIVGLTAAATGNESAATVATFSDSQALAAHFRALGYQHRGGIDRSVSELDTGQSGSFPHFSPRSQREAWFTRSR